jgi:phosphocarrier protein
LPALGLWSVSQTVTRIVTIQNKLGLHARPAMMFVETASRFACDIAVCRADDCRRVDGKSIMQMMMLAATHGTDIQITARGDDAAAAIESLVSLVDSMFNEE